MFGSAAALPLLVLVLLAILVIAAIFALIVATRLMLVLTKAANRRLDASPDGRPAER